MANQLEFCVLFMGQQEDPKEELLGKNKIRNKTKNKNNEMPIESWQQQGE